MRSECAVANGLEILGDRWTLLIVRDMMFTNRSELGHFLNSREGISTNILTERLERLQSHGIINKQLHPEHGKKFIYQLTDTGIKLAPTIIELTLWATQNIENTFTPPDFLDMMKKSRKKLINRINKKECLMELDL